MGSRCGGGPSIEIAAVNNSSVQRIVNEEDRMDVVKTDDELVRKVAVVFGVAPGSGGLGIQVANAINDWSTTGFRVHAVGPGLLQSSTSNFNVDRTITNTQLSKLRVKFTWLRWLHGRRQWLTDRATGRRAVASLSASRPDLVYTFTQVGLESLAWATREGIPTILESPNGHIRNFREVYVRETTRFGGVRYFGHPTQQMIDRVEKEYKLAKIIRVSSDWAKATMTERGVPSNKIVVIEQNPTAQGVLPKVEETSITGPLRVCFVGTLDLRKGFVYLLRAARRLGPNRITIRLVGGTVDSFTRRLLSRERKGLAVEVLPGDPRPTLGWAELFVLPTLEDGSPFALVEALAAGLPAIVTDACGNSPLVRPNENGWIVPAGDELALYEALTDACHGRKTLKSMGMASRMIWEQMNFEKKDERVFRLWELASKLQEKVFV
jgi:glycosyltransferase involved in cell wall biosynthesis